MSRRHFDNQPGTEEKFNIITGNQQASERNTTPRYEKLSAQGGSVFSSDNNDTTRFQTTSGLMGKESQNRSNEQQQQQSPQQQDANAPYYGRQKKTNEFYSKTGVFSAQGTEDHPLGKNVDTSARAEPQSSEQQQHNSKYSRYY
eukprot:CAMPEP_0117444182 /NCGR_PEP_ID=MMETSP0759-20121206/5101_1 /TAXON_ID=63605 /ORGANISM="Percolomonas cosmopolitus, Strain WS" /LENGTH=143 /DNA_ID=CAMNT_0005236225 /DNA_START=96 /DNA_END=527 /DNA_ORIENTATION=+